MGNKKKRDIAELLIENPQGLTKDKLKRLSGKSAATVSRELTKLRATNCLRSERDLDGNVKKYIIQNPPTNEGTTLEDIINHSSEENLLKSSKITDSGKDTSDGKITLYLGELGLGTRVSDKSAYEGLAGFIKANDLKDKIGHVVINGGLLPEIPLFYGRLKEQLMIFLANNPDQPIHEKARKALETEVDPEIRKYIEKWAAYKVTNSREAVDLSRNTLEPLMEVLKDAQWHYQPGEEDKENIQNLLEIKINDKVRRENEYQSRLNTLEKKKEKKEYEKSKLKIISDKKEFIQEFYSTVKEAEDRFKKETDRFKKDGTTKRELISDVVSTYLSDNNEVPKKLGFSETDISRMQGLKKSSTVQSIMSRIEQQHSKSKEKVRNLEESVREEEKFIQAYEREMESSQFHRITKRHAIDPASAEILRREAKWEYSQLLYDIFKDLLDNEIKIHSGNANDTVLDGVEVLLKHKASINSIVANNADVRKSANQLKSSSRRKKDLPDICVLAHGAKGFRHIPVPKKRETIMDGKNRETPEYCVIMQLPTMQDPELLEYFAQKGLKVEHIKRWEKHNYASGAVIYNVKETGEHEPAMIEFSRLKKAGEISSKIRNLEQTVKLARSDESKENALKEIDSLKEKLKVDTYKLLIVTDTHIGCPTKDGRPSNYDFIEASKKYVNEHGLPDVLVLNGDMIQAIKRHAFHSNGQYLSDIPSEREQKVNEILGSDMSDLEKIALISDIAKSNHESIPITNNSLQFSEFKRRLVPLVHDVLENGGQVIIASGNHYNQSTEGKHDEATEISNMLDIKWINSPNVKKFVGMGESAGLGEAKLPNGWTIYSAHRPKRGSDVVVGALNQLEGMGNDAELAIFGDVHHPGGGYADGTYVAIGAAMQGWVPFVDSIGMQASLRGIMELEIPKEGTGYMKWRYILDPTLEPYMNRKK